MSATNVSLIKGPKRDVNFPPVERPARKRTPAYCYTTDSGSVGTSNMKASPIKSK